MFSGGRQKLHWEPNRLSTQIKLITTYWLLCACYSSMLRVYYFPCTFECSKGAELSTLCQSVMQQVVANKPFERIKKTV